MNIGIELETLNFRLATSKDAASIVALVTSGYRGEASRTGWTTEADLIDGPRTSEAEVCVLIADSESAILIAERDNDLVGCCNIARREAQVILACSRLVPVCNRAAWVG